MSVSRWSWGVCLWALMAAALPCAAQIDLVGPIEGDFNGDSFVGVNDLSILLIHWSQAVTPGDILSGDANGDGWVGVDDLNILLNNWNLGYPLPPQRNLSLGINLSQVKYYNREWVFVDAVKQAKPWVSTNPNGSPFDTGEVVATDPDGWPLLTPGKAAQTIMFSQTQGAYPGGVYVCTYDGTGDIQFQWDANAFSASPGRIEVNVTPSNAGILMRITVSDQVDPIRNIKLWMPGFENAASSFHPLFIQRLSKFKVVRFMDWELTNSAQPGINWLGRTLPSRYSQHAPGGVAVEYMIELCNELGADPWFCMPHTADDAYIQSFASLVAGGLNADRKVYIEWSNEVWNNRFDAYGWVEAQSGAAPFSSGWFDLWAQRVSDTFSIWEQTLAGQQSRLVRVAPGQAANIWVTRNLTDRLVGQLDAVSCSGYFDDSKANFDATTTALDVISDAAIRAIPDRSEKFYQDHGNLAQDLSVSLGRTIRFIGYEGGQHYADDNRNLPYAQAFLDIQTLPQMFSVYLQNLNAFEQAGGDLFLAFNYVGRPGNHGAWGHLEHQDDSIDISPKFKALLYYVKDQ